MKIKVEQFCALATSASWQAWLYKFDNNIYINFIDNLHKSKNCTQNREIMSDTLELIKRSGRSAELYEFLKQQFPYVIVEEGVTTKTGDIHGVFPGYVNGLLTYPHRVILEAPENIIENRVKKFVRGKVKSDFLIIGQHAYIEYLDNSEKDLVNKIPDKNWLINAYRRSKEM